MTESFTVFGDTLLGKTMIGGDLLVNGSLRFSKDGIETYADTLYIQPNRLASLDLMAGTVVINNSGTVMINGNLAITGELAAAKGISTSILSPMDRDLTINLSKRMTSSISGSSSGQLTPSEVEGFGKLLITGPAGYTVASFDAYGNSTQSGTLSAAEVLINKLHVYRTPSATTSGTFAPSIGTGILPAGQSSAIVSNADISTSSLIFITPTSPTTNSLYVVDKEPGAFTVGISAPSTYDITFNWWIVN